MQRSSMGMPGDGGGGKKGIDTENDGVGPLEHCGTGL